MGVKPLGNTAGQCPRTRCGNVLLALSGIQASVGESLFPGVKEEDVYEPQRSPWGFCKGLHYSANTGSSGYGTLTFGQGTILTVHPSKCNRTQHHTGNSGISPRVSGLTEMYVAWESDLAWSPLVTFKVLPFLYSQEKQVLFWTLRHQVCPFPVVECNWPWSQKERKESLLLSEPTLDTMPTLGVGKVTLSS